jgi:hypothetical protein
MPTERDERAFGRFSAALGRCDDAEALIRPFARKLDGLFHGDPLGWRAPEPYDAVVPGVFFGYRLGPPSPAPIRIETAPVPPELADVGHERLIRLERQPETPATWLTLEIEEEPALASCFDRLELLLRGRAAPRPLTFSVGIIANFANRTHRTVGQVPVRFEEQRSRALLAFDLASELEAEADAVTAIKLAIFLPAREMRGLEIVDLRCLGHFADG